MHIISRVCFRFLIFLPDFLAAQPKKKHDEDVTGFIYIYVSVPTIILRLYCEESYIEISISIYRSFCYLLNSHIHINTQDIMSLDIIFYILLLSRQSASTITTRRSGSGMWFVTHTRLQKYINGQGQTRWPHTSILVINLKCFLCRNQPCWRLSFFTKYVWSIEFPLTIFSDIFKRVLFATMLSARYFSLTITT